MGSDSGFAGHTDPVQIFPFANRLAVGCLYKQPTGVVQETSGCLFFQPHNGLRRCGLRSQKSVRINRPLRSPISFAVTSRHFRDVRINQRIDSLPCPALFSMFPGRLARFRGRGFHQTTTIGLRRLELRLDYAVEG